RAASQREEGPERLRMSALVSVSTLGILWSRAGPGWSAENEEQGPDPAGAKVEGAGRSRKMVGHDLARKGHRRASERRLLRDAVAHNENVRVLLPGGPSGWPEAQRPMLEVNGVVHPVTHPRAPGAPMSGDSRDPLSRTEMRANGEVLERCHFLQQEHQ